MIVLFGNVDVKEDVSNNDVVTSIDSDGKLDDMSTNITVTLSALAVEDHLSRLYEDTGDLNRYVHVDKQGAEITVKLCTRDRMRIELTSAALEDLRADADYQADPGDGTGNRTWRRVRDKLNALPA